MLTHIFPLLHALTKMLIDIEGKVIILDEAHNMEDTSREAASLSLTQIQITNVLEEIRELRMLNNILM